MASTSMRSMTPARAQAATNQRIVELLEEIKAGLSESEKRQQQIARDLARLLDRK
jgi:hypothetical protein